MAFLSWSMPSLTQSDYLNEKTELEKVGDWLSSLGGFDKTDEFEVGGGGE